MGTREVSMSFNDTMEMTVRIKYEEDSKNYGNSRYVRSGEMLADSDYSCYVSFRMPGMPAAHGIIKQSF